MQLLNCRGAENPIITYKMGKKGGLSMFQSRNLIVATAALLTFGALAHPAIGADPGVFDDKIVFGQSAAFEGPAAALGIGMREGIGCVQRGKCNRGREWAQT